MSIHLTTVMPGGTSHNGGPLLGHSTTDLDILEAIERRLRESSYYYLRSIHCTYEAGVVTLTGRVPTFYLKQTAQAIVEQVTGDQRVVNLVEVANPAAK